MESWGEIANYLKRDIRTVQRWERDEGLPIHRHQHKTKGTVYAYTGELDRWRKERRSRLEPEPRLPEPTPAPLERKWVLLLAFAALVGVLGFVFVKARPSIARYYNNRGVQLQRSGQIKAAIEDYQWAIRLNSGYAEAHYNLADAYEELPAFDKALDEYQRAIEADPTFYEAYNNLARLYIKQRKDYGAALGLLDRALNLKPQEPSVQYSLYKNYGWASLEMKLFGQSEHYLKSAIALDQGRGSAHCLLAKVLDEQGNETSALPEWEACAAYASQPEVEPEWRVQAEERLSKGGRK